MSNPCQTTWWILLLWGSFESTSTDWLQPSKNHFWPHCHDSFWYRNTCYAKIDRYCLKELIYYNSLSTGICIVFCKISCLSKKIFLGFLTKRPDNLAKESFGFSETKRLQPGKESANFVEGISKSCRNCVNRTKLSRAREEFKKQLW